MFDLDHDEDIVDIKATAPLATDDAEPDLDDEDNLFLNSGLEEIKDDTRAREAKFLLYWATSTSYKTSTTYTGTSTISALECTPPSFAISLCG